MSFGIRLFEPRPQKNVDLSTMSAKDLLLRNIELEEEVNCYERDASMAESELASVQQAFFARPGGGRKNAGFDLHFRGSN